MAQGIEAASEHFIHGMSRIAEFWGFPRGMGAIYGAVYLSPEPVTLDELVEKVGLSKGAVSTNVRNLERLRMIHKHLKVGDRKDYYTAETDFWKIIRGVLRERENVEFDRALSSVNESLAMVKASGKKPEDPELSAFYQERLGHIQSFFGSLDNLVATLLALDDLRAGNIKKLFGKGKA